MAREGGMVLALLALAAYAAAGPVFFRDGGYEGVVVAIDEGVPADGCRNILNTLEVSLATASLALWHALDGRARLAQVTVLLPAAWPDNCAPRYVQSASGEAADVRVGAAHPLFGDAPWTQQSQGCGAPGDAIFLGYQPLLQSRNIGRALMREWAKYRYGVFDEVGYHGDPVYPICYRGDETQSQVTGCSDLPIDDQGLCGRPAALRNASALAHPDARSSLLFAAEAPRVTRFCDERTHDRLAPTKHNLLCDRRSASEVILQHPDFGGGAPAAEPPAAEPAPEATGSAAPNATPAVLYKRRSHTRFVLLVEETQAMLVRESWSFLRFAVRKWALYDLPQGSEVGLVLVNESAPTRLHQLGPLSSAQQRDLVAANLPYTPGDSHAPACLHCGLKEALDMLTERAATHGPASGVVVVVAPGMEAAARDVAALEARALAAGVRIATVNYPQLLRGTPLDALARATGGLAFSVMEERYNMATSFVSTYFKLANVMFSIAQHFHEGRPNAMPIEIHRRELNDESRSSVTGSFVLDAALGEPARFAVFTHSAENPLIRSIALVSPSQFTYSVRSDYLTLVKMLTLHATINETGTWTYYIERYPGNPQPHFVQVLATPRPGDAVVRARAWTSRTQAPLVLYAEVKKGDYPVMGAKVEVIVTRPGRNGTRLFKEKFEMLDTGNGDPDVTKGDGVYSRYFSAAGSAAGLYTFEIIVTDNGNTAYSWQENLIPPNGDSGPVCCGSAVPPAAAAPLQPFQRVLPPISVFFGTEDVSATPVLGRVGDLRARVIPHELKARLHWTAPDMGSAATVQRYELRYATSAAAIVDRWETAGRVWEYGSPFCLAPGAETTFTLEFTRNPSLLDQPLFFRLRAFADKADDAQGGPLSNWVRVLVPRPPPPPPPPSTSPVYSPDLSSWSYDGDDDAAVVPRIAQGSPFTLELILPIVGGIALLALCVAVYCYVCVLRRRHGNTDKKPAHKDKHAANGKAGVGAGAGAGAVAVMNAAGVAGSRSSASLASQAEASRDDAPDEAPDAAPHYDDDEKRFSVAQLQQEEQLLQQMQHEHMAQQMAQQLADQMDGPAHAQALPPSPSRIATIAGHGSLARARTLSPYQSWTASQLLHEHERRHSPYGGPPAVEEVGAAPGPMPPPVPPLPAFAPSHPNGAYAAAGPIYGVHPGALTHAPAYHRNGALLPFNPSLQGSLSSVSSGDRKKRNVTMV